MDRVVLTGESLTLAEVVAVARGGATAVLSAEAQRRMRRSRAVVDRLLEARVKVYGLTTGFGSKKNVFIEPSETRQLQRNLIRSHACGVGDPLDEDVVRATILLRANTLARGLSGIRVEVVERLLSLLSLGIYPFIPSQGSLGASGDLAPLSHLALVLTGDPAGLIFDSSRAPGRGVGPRSGTQIMTRQEDYVAATPERLRALGFEPVELEAKEGLALNNGTQVMTAIGLLTIDDARNLVTCSEGACAMSFEALKGVPRAFSPALHAARPHRGQQDSAAALRRFLAGSQILRLPVNMAYLNAARRSLGDAAFFLSRGVSPLSEDILRNVEEAVEVLDALRLSPEAPLQGDSLEALGEDVALQRYRVALEPLKRRLLTIYRASLSAALPLEVQQAQGALTRALECLERAVPAMPPVQDSYSLRCAPQVIGAARAALDHVEQVLLIEANSVTDNPLIFPPERDAQGRALPIDDDEAYVAALTPALCRRAVCSGGNFHGEPVALVMDYLAVGLAELANISERRTAHLIDGHLNNGLPSLLVQEAGLNSGFMIPQYTAASLVSENKSLAHPASVDSIPSCENTEDHVSMGTIAARKARQILINAEQVLAIELLTAFQALHFHRPLALGHASESLSALFEEAGVTFVDNDRPLAPDMARVCVLIRDGAVQRVLKALPEEGDAWRGLL